MWCCKQPPQCCHIQKTSCAPNIVDIATMLERFSITRVTAKANDTCISSTTFGNNASLSHYQLEKGTGVATVHGTPQRQELCNEL